MPFLPRLQWGRIELPAIVRFPCRFPHTNIAPDQSKPLLWPYKPVISYQVGASGRGGQGEGQHESQLSARTRGTGDRAGQASGPHRNKRITYQRTDPHPTRVGTHLLLALDGSTGNIQGLQRFVQNLFLRARYHWEVQQVCHAHCLLEKDPCFFNRLPLLHLSDTLRYLSLLISRASMVAR